VELDTYLDDKPIQHREVQGHESELFQSYFPKGIIIMEGGADSGFRHVEPVSYKPRLLQVRGDRKHVVVSQIPLARSRVKSDDVFILDLGNQLYQWNGSGSNKDEKFKGMQVLNHIKSERCRASFEVLEEDGTPTDHPFYTSLTEPDEVDAHHHFHKPGSGVAELFRVSDADNGKLQMKKVKEGRVRAGDLDRMDVFILDTGKRCFVWIGSGASPAERKNGFSYAHTHLMKTSHPLVPIMIVKEGQHNAELQAALAA